MQRSSFPCGHCVDRPISSFPRHYQRCTKQVMTIWKWYWFLRYASMPGVILIENLNLRTHFKAQYFTMVHCMTTGNRCCHIMIKEPPNSGPRFYGNDGTWWCLKNPESVGCFVTFNISKNQNPFSMLSSRYFVHEFGYDLVESYRPAGQHSTARSWP